MKPATSRSTQPCAHHLNDLTRLGQSRAFYVWLLRDSLWLPRILSQEEGTGCAWTDLTLPTLLAPYPILFLSPTKVILSSTGNRASGALRCNKTLQLPKILPSHDGFISQAVKKKICSTWFVHSTWKKKAKAKISNDIEAKPLGGRCHQKLILSGSGPRPRVHVFIHSLLQRPGKTWTELSDFLSEFFLFNMAGRLLRMKRGTNIPSQRLQSLFRGGDPDAMAHRKRSPIPLPQKQICPHQG